MNVYRPITYCPDHVILWRCERQDLDPPGSLQKWAGLFSAEFHDHPDANELIALGVTEVSSCMSDSELGALQRFLRTHTPVKTLDQIAVTLPVSLDRLGRWINEPETAASFLPPSINLTEHPAYDLPWTVTGRVESKEFFEWSA